MWVSKHLWISIVLAFIILFSYTSVLLIGTPLTCLQVYAGGVQYGDLVCYILCAIVGRCCDKPAHKLLISTFSIHQTTKIQAEYQKDLDETLEQMDQLRRYLGRVVPAAEMALNFGKTPKPKNMPEFDAIKKALRNMPYSQRVPKTRDNPIEQAKVKKADVDKMLSVRSWARFEEIKNIEDKYMDIIDELNGRQALTLYFMLNAYNGAVQMERIQTRSRLLQARAWYDRD